MSPPSPNPAKALHLTLRKDETPHRSSRALRDLAFSVLLRPTRRSPASRPLLLLFPPPSVPLPPCRYLICTHRSPSQQGLPGPPCAKLQTLLFLTHPLLSLHYLTFLSSTCHSLVSHLFYCLRGRLSVSSLKAEISDCLLLTTFYTSKPGTDA